MIQEKDVQKYAVLKKLLKNAKKIQGGGKLCGSYAKNAEILRKVQKLCGNYAVIFIGVLTSKKLRWVFPGKSFNRFREVN